MPISLRPIQAQFTYLATKAREDSQATMAGYLWKKNSFSGKWQQRYFVLYQNMLFQFESDKLDKAPCGMALLEGSYCEKTLVLRTSRDTRIAPQHDHCFTICCLPKRKKYYELRADSEEKCDDWVAAIRGARYCSVIESRQELKENQAYLLQILETERKAKLQYLQQTDELEAEIKKLKNELNAIAPAKPSKSMSMEESDQLRKIKKVQSFLRGWLCRRRWKHIVEEYLLSPHAESMRKRNSIVFKLFEGEEEYVQQLITLVTCFLRPFRMAASSKKPIITHEDVNSIYLNVETLMFLHQIFVQGLRRKMENWPTLKLGDLFDMLLPMLGVYQEYVRNHHYSLQVLAEYKLKEEFTRALKRCEEKSQCEGRSIESFLTTPMYQIPRYLVTLHEILAHTPHEHVDRTNLEYAKRKLETLSQVIHDEVSETENIRKNLAIERMISDGCDILLDANQVFVRQGTLAQVTMNKATYPCSRITQLSSSSCEKKERLRQVFLFTNHLLIATRTNSGRLKLAKKNGKIPLQGCALIEEMGSDLSQDESGHGSPPPNDTPESGLSPVSRTQSVNSFGGQEDLIPMEPQQQQPTPPSPSWNLIPAKLAHGSLMLAALTLGTTGGDYAGKFRRETRTSSLNRKNVADDSGDDSPTQIASLMSTSPSTSTAPYLGSYRNLAFQITWPGNEEETCSIWLVASNLQEKEAWCSDISQCIEQLHYSDMLSIAHSEVSSISMPYSVRLDPGLFKDCPDIKYRSTRNSCKMPQVRHGTLGRLLDRLLDPRFQSIDYLNTFLLTYRVFTTGLTIIAVLRCVLRDPSLQLASTKIDLDLLESMLQARPGVRRASQQHNDSLTFTGIKGGRRVSTGMIDATRHQVFFPRRNLATEKVLEEEEHESGDSESEEDIETRRIKSASEADKLRKFLFSEASRGSSKEGIKNISHDIVKEAEELARNASLENRFDPLTIEEESRDNLKLLGHSREIGNGKERDEESEEGGETEEEGEAKGDEKYSFSKADKSALVGLSPMHAVKMKQAESGTGKQVIASEFIFPITNAGSPLMTFFGNKENQSAVVPDLSIIKSRSVSTSAPNRTSLTRQQSRVSYTCGTPTYRRAPRAGAIITSARLSRRRSSNWAAVKAFAIATAASSSTRMSHQRRISAIHRSPMSTAAITAITTSSITPTTAVASTSHFGETPPVTTMASVANWMTPKEESPFLRLTTSSGEGGREEKVASMTVLRVLNVARHWITKYPEDFDGNAQLKSKMQVLLEELLRNPRLNVSNRKVAFQLSREMLNDQLVESHVDLDLLMTPSQVPSKENFDKIPALDIAEELTYLDFHIFRSIKTQELLNQVWMKDGKETKAPHVMLVTKRFNEVSKLVVSEIISRSEIPDRAACIEKWIAIADICRCLQNYNGVLQICAALENSSVHRLKATWEVVAKQSKQSFEKLLTLVAATARFKNLRELLHRCDPPCIPYLGMYLTDLSFIGEGALDITEHGLINFCKMRMLAHVLMEIRRYTQTPYMIELRQEVVDYLLDPTRLLSDDQTYEASLSIEPRRPFTTVCQAEGENNETGDTTPFGGDGNK
ncbi:Ras-specific guanine nucleotide-releasing factor 2 [Echinococcus granulosus]|nr:Ras-specific guanine nucleotide-releasing factor 2 [Echinococcus granulosus]